ncbi:Susd and RagB outer membrane lipoprotein [Chitinophaga jiangningensis]|uniref:Susd and RagB outer membrane lipoprotein n=1 Tax=Chitinophaga jiangningensis TaxID=1419482 RepID=A0A1M7K584_9BACT|nr:SusD/RagB family nutrient-binding outer membrane lipoprotein [Chitinophaga jiangningensis]SHM60462.1 Susd and RagB outer membrane lipoprotein [Chitinophaga jiangningensis]
MKKNLRYIVVPMLLSLAACTKNFENINTNPGKITDISSRELPFMFSRAQSAAPMNQSYYQTAQNLYADLYAQYFALTTTNFQTDRYVINDGWLPRPGIVANVLTAPQLKTIFENTAPASGEYSLASIMWVYTFHRFTDYFGPVPYFKVGEAQLNIPYDAQDKIYDDFFKRLDTSVNNLKQLTATNVFGTYDLMYGGDVQQWIRFANTLRLRLAMRISIVDPARAKQEAEAAIAGGVMTETSHTAWLKRSLLNDGNGLSQIGSYNEFSMSSTMASYLKGYNDPRMAVFFQPSVAGNAYRGLRNGSSTTAINQPMNRPAQTSNVGKRWAVWNGAAWTPQLTASQAVIYAAEAYFLRAEAALNGWNAGGTAQELYEKGIEVSMKEWGIADATAISNYIQGTSTPAAPGDVENSPAVASIPVKFGASATVQRQQIGTQKWLAIYPDGIEAWAEFRRSGYPVMYPVVQSDNTDLPAGTFINRLPYPSTEATTNGKELEKGRQLLGGPDNAATKLWWDKN